jgi:hypothetical protein|tara:strand:+ start:1264 stop:2130 length:867 start_codon:yes stop_codon:yes gene_type:complete
MEYLRGYNIKPNSVSETGVVYFTDGSKFGITPSQQVCEAYGYYYDHVTKTCQAFPFTPKPSQNVSKGKNIIKGRNNVDVRTKSAVILGNNNTTTENTNLLLLGQNHNIDNKINNSSIVGGGSALLSRQSEVAIGGGVHAISDRSTTLTARRQMSVVKLSGITIDNVATKLTVQGDGSSYINVKNNSIIGYDVYLTRFELGGSAGTAGNYSYRELKGAVQIDDSYNMAFVIGSTTTIAKIGVDGTFTVVDSSTTDVKSITIEVTDRTNVNNLWSATVYIHEAVSTVTTF